MNNIINFFNKRNDGPRFFYALDKDDANKYCENYITTSRYTVITFIPKFLFDQFKKSSNVYFLVIALLQQIPGVSPIGKYISGGVLFAILSILAIKEIIEDIRRHKSDKRMNNISCEIFRGKWIVAKWYNIKVGDYVKVSAGQTIPADMIILATSEPNQACYIQTSSLDGETNYKIRNCRAESACFMSENNYTANKLSVNCEPPNKDLYKFNGVIQIGLNESFPVNNDQLVLRGCQLKNTAWVVGVVVYTGPETKIMLNSSSVVIKRSSVDKGIDKLTYILYGLLIFLTLISTIKCEHAFRNAIPKHWYMSFKMRKHQFIYTTLTFFILYHNFVPVSLLVTVEIVKVIQAYIINMDKYMYGEKSMYLPVVKTCGILEDLGMINYIFSDKTGTLTCNEMVLREFSIGSKHYRFNAEFANGINEGKIKTRDEDFYLFFINLLLCNSVVPECTSDENNNSFQSSSPDESAIINALYEFGFKFIHRTNDGIEIEYLGQREYWNIILTVEFTSERQRMSVIAKSSKGKYYLFIKGADSVILQRILDKDSAVYESTHLYLESFAKNGLRTLCIAYKELTEDEVNIATKEIDEVLSKIDNRDAGVNAAADKIEQNFILLGCTGIEDKLQENVGETIRILREANIKIWMLTGDKLETAINIGYSCNLLDESLQLRVLNSQNHEDCLHKLVSLANAEFIPISTKKKIRNPKYTKPLALVITGHDIKFILTDECSNHFVNIAIHCKTVICCRISPSQKQDILLLVKNRISDSCTLAVGDGANDCSMIRAANIGVGIVGKEGLHAANTADFAIDQFKILTRLLLAHGAISYRRICNCVYFVFYKNVVLNMLPFYYNFSNFFSGKTLVNKFHFPFFNNFYTSLPPFCFGLLDRTSSFEAQTNLPYLYSSVRKNYKFGAKRFILWCINALFHSLFIYILSVATFSKGVYSAFGYTITTDLFGTWIVILTVILISLKAAIEIRNWSWLSQLGIWGGIFNYLFFVFFFGRRLPRKIWIEPSLLDHDILLFSSPLFYISLLIPFFVILPDFIFHCVRNTWFTPSHILVTHIEENKKMDWSEPSLVQSINSELDKSNKQKHYRQRKYFGYAFSVDEESNKRNSIIKNEKQNF